MPFSAESLILIAAIFFFAAIVHGSIGFGFPMVATPLLALVTDIQSAIILTLIPTILVNLVSFISEGDVGRAFRRHLPLALLAMIGSAIGTLILIVSHSDLFKLLLAGAILVYLVADRVKLNLGWVRVHPTLSRGLFGLTAGMLGGLTNVMAPVLIIYSLESRHAKGDIIQAANLCFLLGKLMQLVIFSVNGDYTVSQAESSLWMLGVVAVALYAGVQLNRRIRQKLFRRLLRGLLLLLALLLLVQATVFS